MPGGGFDVSVSDIVGNKLNGSFTGVFPSGTTPQTNADFVENLGFLTVQAPVITSFQLETPFDSGTLGDNNTNL